MGFRAYITIVSSSSKFAFLLGKKYLIRHVTKP